jgi:hypothetical protein
MPFNQITKTPVSSLGYGFIAAEDIPKGKDEYYLRNMQNRNGMVFRKLTAYEIEVLVRNRNTCDDWNKFMVTDAFNPELVKNCSFRGLIRIGKLEPYFLDFSDFKTPVGLYNSTIINCDFGENVSIDNVNYLSHYIIGDEAIIVNVNELATTNKAKFGNGIIKRGEDEQIRIWMELRNENGGRSVLPFNGMLPGDAWLWSQYRSDDVLLKKLKEFTEARFDNRQGYYGKIGNRTVIKNCKIIKDVWVGNDAYFKGANKLKNLTVNSGTEGKTQIGEGCELVNGIINDGCRIFYGSKAVRFFMASHSQLKYGARLINSYLGNNATISCCEVLNSLIFPAHEQHHNNSFLCAAMVMGQSNIAAGATLGSNHNSRGADGEMIAGRGFWPGLCVSIKHNSRFASFTILSKGDYLYELDIKQPFSLVSNNAENNTLSVMPAYWMMYNMYALARNSWKYVDRDKRVDKKQFIEYDFLAPDTINEIFLSIEELATSTGKAWFKKAGKPKTSITLCNAKGHELLSNNSDEVKDLEILLEQAENSKRKVIIEKAAPAYLQFKTMIYYYGINQLIYYIEKSTDSQLKNILQTIPSKTERKEWINVGGQLITTTAIETLKTKIKSGKIKSWDEVHQFYITEGNKYTDQKCLHGLAALSEIAGVKIKLATPKQITEWLTLCVKTKQDITTAIEFSRAKDYKNHFRQMVYDSIAEMNKIIGSLDENSFIKNQQKELLVFSKKIVQLKKKFKLS